MTGKNPGAEAGKMFPVSAPGSHYPYYSIFRLAGVPVSITSESHADTPLQPQKYSFIAFLAATIYQMTQAKKTIYSTQ